jgi:putative membrane protein insertion efficiency factor
VSAPSSPPLRGRAAAPGEAPAASAAARIARAIVLSPIVLYQRLLSPAIPRRCKYEPTCSRYAVEAVRRYGILRGLVLAGWRLLRCNPWSHGGYDPVEAQRVFRIGTIADSP